MKNLLKKIIGSLLALQLIINIVSVPIQAADDIHVELNGEELEFDVPPQIIDNRIMLPVRAVFEAMGATISWDDVTKTVTARKIIGKYDSQFVAEISMTEGSDEFYYQGGSLKRNPHKMDVALTNVNGRVLAPLRIVAYSLGYCVNWYEPTKTAYIESPDSTYQGKFYSGTNIPTFSSVVELMSFVDAENYYFTGKTNYSYRYSIKQTATDDYNKYLNFLENNAWVRLRDIRYSEEWNGYCYCKDDIKLYVSINYEEKDNTRLYTFPYYISLSFDDGTHLSVFDD